MTPGGDPSRPPVVVLAGPTASGKSGLALALAEAFDGVIVNADSMQVYRELRILTARPDEAALARAPHRLYGSQSGREPCSAGRWRLGALAEVEAAHSAGKLPLLVGGTGLYLRALQEGLADIPSVPDAVRAAAVARHRSMGGVAFKAELARRDPVSAARLHANDSQRLIRAWEVFEATGRSLVEWQADAGAGPPPFRFLNLVLLPPRTALYARADARFDGMLAAGALAEVAALLALGYAPGLPVMKALGVPELADHLAGRRSLAEAAEAARQSTRRYAKRQFTWLRNQLLGNDPNALVVNTQYSESLNAEIFNNIRQNLLTGSG
jgi:tRNA dimethylallyltransferase